MISNKIFYEIKIYKLLSYNICNFGKSKKTLGNL